MKRPSNRQLAAMAFLSTLALCWGLAMAKIVVVESSREMSAQLDRVRSEWIEARAGQRRVELAYRARLTPAGLERARRELNLELPRPQQVVRAQVADGGGPP